MTGFVYSLAGSKSEVIVNFVETGGTPLAIEIEARPESKRRKERGKTTSR